MSELSFMEKLLDGVKVEWHALGDMTEYSPTRVDAAVLDKASFVGVDNLVAEKGGRVDANYLPNTTRLTAYEPGDILIGNIRPYLKKVWRATNSGGCSGDVLAVRIQENNKPFVDSAFLYYLLSSDDFFSYNMQHAKGAKMPRGDKSAILKYQIPIPCPDNPAKSLEIQSKIVRILDTFTELTAELTAELSLRKKQYNHYRDQLLSFEEGEVEWRTLGSVCGFKNGFAFKSNLFRETGLPIIRITNVNGSSVNLTDVKYFDPSDYKENTKNYSVIRGDILIAMSGATTGKVGCFDSAETAYLNQRVGKFIPDTELLESRYLYHFLLSKTEQIYVLAGGGAQPNLSSKALMEKLLIPIPHAKDPINSITEQKRISSILDKFNTLTTSISEGLPREIELRQKQYEYYRDLLLSFPKPDASKSEAAA